ncbi:hypothetical protein OEZ81_25915, partial [Leclercia adecarboxylata]|nr:hypothetical protein [Leclercia adecarboxylata]
AWTLSIELFFYLLFPMILVIFRRLDPRATWCCAGGAGAIIVALGAASIGPGTLALPLLGTGSDLQLPLLRLPGFIYGVALCRLTGFYPGLGRRIGGHLAGLLVVIAILTVMATADAMTTKAVVSILVGILIVQLTGGEGVVSRVLRAPV